MVYLEERLENLETAIHSLKEQCQALKDACAGKLDPQQLQDGISALKVELLAAIKDKADIEQVGQCVQAVRFELSDVLKRKASAELLDSTVEKIQSELTDLATRKMDIEQADGRFQVLQGSQHEMWEVLQRKADIELLDKYVLREELNTGLDGKVDKREVERLDQAVEARRKEFAEAHRTQLGALEACLNSKASIEDVLSLKELHKHLQKDLCSKADGEVLEQRLRSMSAEVQDQLCSKADVGLVKSEVRSVSKEAAERVREDLLTMVQMKADVDMVTASMEAIQGKLAAVQSIKADREKVVECVEAVRDELTAALGSKATAQDVDRCVERVHEVQQQLMDKVETKVDLQQVNQCIQVVRQDFGDQLKDKADLDSVDQRVQSMHQSVNEQLEQRLQVVRQELSDRASRYEAGMSLLEQNMESMRAEAIKSPKQSNAQGDSQMNVNQDWVESEMEHRMRLLRTELTKLVNLKAETSHVEHRLQAVKSEITDSVDLQVQAVKQELTTQVRETRKELAEMVSRKADAADVQVLTNMLKRGPGSHGERSSASTPNRAGRLDGQSPAGARKVEESGTFSPPGRASPTVRLPPVLRSGQSAPNLHRLEDDPDDDWRSRRVRSLLTSLVNVEKKDDKE